MMIDWAALLSAGDAPTPAALADPGQEPAANGSAPAPAGLPGIADPERAGDNRRRCAECGNLASNGRCLAAARREIVASRTYTPARDTLHRCAGFKPLANDPDQRPGRDRWPGL
jgi:hypothetical protein